MAIELSTFYFFIVVNEYVGACRDAPLDTIGQTYTGQGNDKYECLKQCAATVSQFTGCAFGVTGKDCYVYTGHVARGDGNSDYICMKV